MFGIIIISVNTYCIVEATCIMKMCSSYNLFNRMHVFFIYVFLISLYKVLTSTMYLQAMYIVGLVTCIQKKDL